MELKINIGYTEILALIKQLPPNQILQLKAELEKSIMSTSSQSTTPNPLQKILLKGPVMSDTQYHEFTQTRKHFATWRTL